MLPTIQPVILKGAYIRLEPLSLELHHDCLVEAALEGGLYTTTITVIPAPDRMKTYITTALQEFADGKSLPFAIVENSSNKAVGTTRFLNIERKHHRVEIGSTWLALRVQRSAVNSEAKLLLLTHAFERLGCYRVEFKTDVLNTQSRTAILRLGAKEEGIFRRHMVMPPDDRVRDTVYFSILDSEWASIKARLEANLESIHSSTQGVKP